MEKQRLGHYGAVALELEAFADTGGPSSPGKAPTDPNWKRGTGWNYSEDAGRGDAGERNVTLARKTL